MFLFIVLHEFPLLFSRKVPYINIESICVRCVLKRIPKNYDGNQPTSRRVTTLLPGFLNRLSHLCAQAPHQITLSWSDVVGTRLASMSKAIEFKEGVLRVSVANSALHSLLVQHEKPRLIAALREKFPKVKINDILFRIG